MGHCSGAHCVRPLHGALLHQCEDLSQPPVYTWALSPGGHNVAILTAKQAAGFLNCSYSHLYQMRAAGRGPRFFKDGTFVKYRREDLDAWVEERLRK